MTEETLSVADLHRAGTINSVEIVAAITAYMSDPKSGPYRFASGHSLSVSEVMSAVLDPAGMPSRVGPQEKSQRVVVATAVMAAPLSLRRALETFKAGSSELRRKHYAGCRTPEPRANQPASAPLGSMSNQALPLERSANTRGLGRDRAFRFRAGAAAVVILAASTQSGYTQSSDEQAIALLRASSTQSAIITFCAHHYEVDGTTALRISKTARDVAAKVLGQEQSDAAFKDELARRYAEVKEVGEQQWCADQRAALAQSDTPVFKN